MTAENADLWSIGELAERAGVTVKTVRFYSDRGLLPEATRSAGAHRRYGPEALDRLRLIRSLRALDLPVPEVGGILDRLADHDDRLDDGLGEALGDVLEDRLSDVGARLAALRWQEASLRLLRDGAPEERAEWLRLIGGLPGSGAPPNTAAFARFWRAWLPPRMSGRVVAAFLDEAVPQVPDDPTPAQVLAFARLHAFVSTCSPVVDAHCRPEAHRSGADYRPALLYEGLGEAHVLTAAEIREGNAPHAGQALDAFVAAHAAALGARDTPEFRRRLSALLAAEARIGHYWDLVAELRPASEPTPGVMHEWLEAALG
ncbi:MerR family transcriptional regulator [Streptomyces sp. NPDC002851]